VSTDPTGCISGNLAETTTMNMLVRSAQAGA